MEFFSEMRDVKTTFVLLIPPLPSLNFSEFHCANNVIQSTEYDKGNDETSDINKTKEHLREISNGEFSGWYIPFPFS